MLTPIVGACRHLSARAGELEKARAATDAYRIDLLQQKLGERELDLQALQEALASLEEENTGVDPAPVFKSGSKCGLAALGGWHGDNRGLASCNKDFQHPPGALCPMLAQQTGVPPSLHTWRRTTCKATCMCSVAGLYRPNIRLAWGAQHASHELHARLQEPTAVRF